jgi:hypothetical protein
LAARRYQHGSNSLSDLLPKPGRIPPHATRTSSCVLTAARSESPWKPIRGEQILGDKVGIQSASQAVETQVCNFVEQSQHGCIRQSIHFCSRHTCSTAYSCPHPSASCIKVRGEPTSCCRSRRLFWVDQQTVYSIESFAQVVRPSARKVRRREPVFRSRRE